jgi:hypothetical protein
MALLHGYWDEGSNQYKVIRSLKFNSADSPTVVRTNAAAATSAQKMTISGWIRRTTRDSNSGGWTGLGGAGSQNDCIVLGAFTGDANRVDFQINNTNDGHMIWSFKQTDPTAWYHLVLAIDTTQATAANRLKMYVNGVLQTSLDTNSPPAQNYSFNYLGQNGKTFTIGSFNASRFFDGSVAECYYIDGQQLAPTAFGATDPVTGAWNPIKYSGTYGNNGWYLDFSNTSSLANMGLDRSGNGNNFTLTNFVLSNGVGQDTLRDSPTDYIDPTDGSVHGNFAVMVPYGGTVSVQTAGTSAPTMREGGYGYTGSGSNQGCASSLIMRGGKWYCEVTLTTSNGLNGIMAENTPQNGTFTYPGFGAFGWGCYTADGHLYHSGAGPAYGSAYSNGDIQMIAFDGDNGKIWWGKNGTWFASGDPAAGTSPGYSGLATNIGYWFAIGHNASVNQDVNFGQRNWTYTPPTGFKALCIANLPVQTVTSGSFTGNAAANGPFIDCGGMPTTVTINSNAVTWGTHAVKMAGGFKLITTSTSYNSTSTNTWTATGVTSRNYTRAQMS